MIEIKHNQKGLWIESGILDDINPGDKLDFIPLNGHKDGMEKKIIEFAKRKAIEEDPITFNKKNAQHSDTYKFIMGAMTEVLVEFYLKMFELTNYDLKTIHDTSENKFEKGFDLVGISGYKSTFKAHIQVKWRFDSNHKFKASSLKTMVERFKEEGIDSRNLYLIVVSARQENPKDVLHWRDTFPDMNIITGRKMSEKIMTIQCIDKNNHPFTEFWEYFKESLETVN